MIKKLIFNLTLLSILFVFTVDLSAKTNKKNTDDIQEVYQLSYIEREPGVDDYEITMLVSERYIRIDEVGESSGFIVYDDKEHIIYSVSHHDQSVLVINKHDFSEKDLPVNYEVEYLPLADAPAVSGKAVFNYRVFVGKGESEVTCMEIQLVENLLPRVNEMLANYQQVVSGQQVKMTDNKLNEQQTACYFVDQIYNTGAYYKKGLPIQEWHSNERYKILTSYKKIPVKASMFLLPEEYRKFSIDNNSKTFIQ